MRHPVKNGGKGACIRVEKGFALEEKEGNDGMYVTGGCYGKKYAFLLMGKDFNPQREACFSAGGVGNYIITIAFVPLRRR